MGILDYIIIAVVAACAVAALVYIVRKHKKGCYCSGNCGICPYKKNDH